MGSGKRRQDRWLQRKLERMYQFGGEIAVCEYESGDLHDVRKFRVPKMPRIFSTLVGAGVL
jgi:hypothetical protein